MRALSDATADMLKPLPGMLPTDRLEVQMDADMKQFVVRVTACKNDSGWQNYPSMAAQRHWLERITERKELTAGTGKWLIAATDLNAEVINAVWGQERIVWKDDKAPVVFAALLLSTTRQDMNAQVYARYKEHKEVPKHNLLLHAQHPLAPYQQVAGFNMLGSEGYGLFMEQGTGKTPVVVTHVCTAAVDRDWRHPFRGIIVCPNNVRVNWVREFERFATVPGKINVIRGGKINRVSQIIEAMVPEEDCQYSICVMSYDAMVRTIDTLTAIEWDMGVLDEAHYIKWPKALRSRTALQLRDACKSRFVLTGTPVCNTPLDLFMLWEFMGEGWSGFKSWEKFREFYGVFDKDVEGDNEGKLVAIQNLPFMKERLARTSFIIRKTDALPDLPEKVYDTCEVEMTGPQQEAYEKIARELLLEIENELDSSENKAMTINNILTQLLRLAQISCGYCTWDEVVDPVTLEVLRPKRIEFFKDDPKLEMLVELLKEKTPDQKTIVWSCFVPCIKLIEERLKKEGIRCVTYYGQTGEEERLEAERLFNYDPEVKVIIGNPAAGGTGVNLLGYPPHGGDEYTTNCDHAIYYAQDWSMVKRAQSEDRCHRRGTRTNVRITDLCVPETIDETIRVRVLEKKMMALEIADIREILSAVLGGLKNVEV